MILWNEMKWNEMKWYEMIWNEMKTPKPVLKGWGDKKHNISFYLNFFDVKFIIVLILKFKSDKSSGKEKCEILLCH